MRRLLRITLVGALTLASATALAADPKKGKGKGGKAPAGKKKAKTEKVEGEGGDAGASAGAGEEYKAAYGSAGCGLGSIVIKKGGFMQVFAATLNGTGVQTFGITTGTSNCKGGKEAAVAEQQVFIETNLASLTKEAAQGEGEHLTAFAELLGCDHDAFAEESRENYSELYNSDKPEAVLENHRAHFAGNCERAVF